MKKILWRLLPLFLAGSTFFVAGTLGQTEPASGNTPQPNEANATCMACHSKEAGTGPAVDESLLLKSPHAPLACTDCHSAIKGFPHTDEMKKEKAACKNCHTEQQAAFAKSMHANPDFEKGDHPSCIFCHGGGNQHAITAGRKWTRAQKAQVCTQCHEQTGHMKRYHVDPDAVTSYYESFHGKALLRFDDPQRTAICTDCHGHHDVLSPMNPAAPTHANNAAKTCGQEGCHVGAKANFAMSGANHLRLKVTEEPLLQGVLLFFRALIFLTISFLLANVALDLRKTVFLSKEPPKCGRPAAVMIFFAFMSLVASIALATVKLAGTRYAVAATIGFLALAYVFHFLNAKHRPKLENQTQYPRMGLIIRVQHILLMLSITTLMATGLPLRFASSDLAQKEITMLGGLETARYVHRVAAVVLIFVWVWHVGYLLVRWARNGWKFQSWTMFVTRKDLSDFLQAIRHYLGYAPEEPKFDRYTFRSKIDYLAEYWGLPVMVLSGFVLWFPMYFSDHLPEAAWPIAFIAHGYEATLALLAIVCWHLYNVQFSPNVFPMNRVWLTGKLSHEEMEREHPLELERILRNQSEEASSGPDSGKEAKENGPDA